MRAATETSHLIRPVPSTRPLHRIMPRPRTRGGERERSDDYAARLARIREGNALWRAGQHPGADRLRTLVLEPENMGLLVTTLSKGGFPRENRALAERIADACRRESYASLITAAHFGGLYGGLKKGGGRPFDLDRAVAIHDRFRPLTGHLLDVLVLADRLQRLDLMPMFEAPTEEEVLSPASRFMAHLWARAQDSGYVKGDRADGLLRLVDEFPESAAAVLEMAKDGRAPSALRAALSGEVVRPLADGAL